MYFNSFKKLVLNFTLKRKILKGLRGRNQNNGKRGGDFERIR